MSTSENANQQLELAKEYQQRFSPVEEYRDKVWKVLCAQFWSRYVKPSDEVLDLGCGWGEFISNIEAKTKHGMDLNPDAAQKLPDDVLFHCQDCSKPWPVADDSLDVVFTSNFFEHLPNKDLLRSTLEEAKRCLKPGGKLICLGPNIRFLHGTYWDFWDHHVALSDYSLTEVLRILDFRIAECTPRFLPYTMARESQPPVFLLKAYLRLKLAWPLLGKQFLIVAEA